MPRRSLPQRNALCPSDHTPLPSTSHPCHQSPFPSPRCQSALQLRSASLSSLHLNVCSGKLR
ncbi:hypothetical protein E2C01_101031 [Portunus trituberculatus]|uniref:Uncharacterized protein n=1 Tax=Portunus trituberculatus TaxID=210409 RepID=A0A5B7KF31_PORTR|nr:hypothetical protein [Portunus trituberculatus]